ncbi:MAG TPA: MFS transporter, partial [Armatimonadota bacterium]|nr:MFS transporter [Armatimonadota bacterium]
GNETRGALEFPREAPGFLVTVSTGILAALSETRVAAIAALVAALGMLGLGALGRRQLWILMQAFMCTQSAGTHLGMPINRSIGMSLARRNQEGRRLGQINSVRVAAAIGGSLLVLLLLNKLGLHYRWTFLAGAVAYALSGAALMFMSPTVGSRQRPRFAVNKRYWLFYALSILFGARKQIFITFGPWVLIKVHGQEAAVFAGLWMVSSICGVFWQPLVGKLVDHWGERAVLMADACVLVLVCAGYGFGDKLGLGSNTIYLLYACYILDQLMFAVGMARATYLKKIAVSPDHVASSLALGISLDHTVSMTIPRLGGWVWDRNGKYGFRYVFAGGACIALLTLLFASFIRIPEGASGGHEMQADEPGIPRVLDEGGEG